MKLWRADILKNAEAHLSSESSKLNLYGLIISMRHHEKTLRQAQDALARALQDLESSCSIPHDDPVLSELKADIRSVLNIGAAPELAAAE